MVAGKGLHKAEDGSADLPWALVLSPTSCVSLSLLISKLLVITSLGMRAYGDNLRPALLSAGGVQGAPCMIATVLAPRHFSLPRRASCGAKLTQKGKRLLLGAGTFFPLQSG